MPTYYPYMWPSITHFKISIHLKITILKCCYYFYIILYMCCVITYNNTGVSIQHRTERGLTKLVITILLLFKPYEAVKTGNVLLKLYVS